MSRFKFFPEEESNVNIVEKSSKGYEKVDFKLSSDYSQSFEINYHTEIVALSNKVLEMKTESIWSIKSIIKDSESYVLNLIIEKHEVYNTNEALNDLVNFTKMFNAPLNDLVIRLDASGTIIEILNQEQIFDKWKLLRQELLSSVDDSPESMVIINNGDKQFSNTLSMLQNTLIYNLFFPAVYGIKIKGIKDRVSGGKFVSQLFQERLIAYDINENVVGIRENELELINESDISNFNKKELLPSYNQYYKESMGDVFDYNISYVANYIYDIKSGLIKNCSIDLNEHANENLFFKGKYSITKI